MASVATDHGQLSEERTFEDVRRAADRDGSGPANAVYIDPINTENLIKLFNVKTVHRDFELRGRIYKEVEFIWVVADRDGPIGQFADLIEDLNLVRDRYTQCYLNECFTQDEVQQFFAYLAAEESRSEIHILRVEVPVKGHQCPIGVCPRDTEETFTPSKGHEGYSLPFDVRGHVDVGDCESREMTDEEKMANEPRADDDGLVPF